MIRPRQSDLTRRRRVCRVCGDQFDTGLRRVEVAFRCPACVDALGSLVDHERPPTPRVPREWEPEDDTAPAGCRYTIDMFGGEG